MASLMLSSCLALLCVTQVQAGAFLAANPASLSAEEVERIIERASTSDEARKALTLLWPALPKNEHGKLDAITVRYALHRYFVHQHGWHVTGLEVSSTPWNRSAEVVVSKHKATSFIQDHFEKLTHGEGMSLEHVTIFANAFTSLVRRESVAELNAIYAFLDESGSHQNLGPITSANLSTSTVDKVLVYYLATHIQGARAVAVGDGAFDYNMIEREVRDRCLVWDDALTWLRDLRSSVEWALRPSRNPFQVGFNSQDVEAMAQEVVHKFIGFQNRDCISLKQMLVEREDDGTGRVPLSRFYGGYMSWDWPFHESAEFLRKLGALDETDPSRPTVIIPNYLSGRSNCVTPSSYYAVCCVDECEVLMAQVEAAVAAPMAHPEQIVQVVSNMESDTVAAPRNISSVQLERLADIAVLHSGKVPLHGRLFAQWMHHAYPRECRFPHLGGTTEQLSRREWTDLLSQETDASEEDLAHHTRMSKDGENNDVKVEDLPWTPDEELFVASHKTKSSHHASSPVLNLVLLALIASAAMPAARRMKSLLDSPAPGKHFV